MEILSLFENNTISDEIIPNYINTNISNQQYIFPSKFIENNEIQDNVLWNSNELLFVNNESHNLQQLPEEIIQEILEYCTDKSSMCLSLSCMQFWKSGSIRRIWLPKVHKLIWHFDINHRNEILNNVCSWKEYTKWLVYYIPKQGELMSLFKDLLSPFAKDQISNIESKLNISLDENNNSNEIFKKYDKIINYSPCISNEEFTKLIDNIESDIPNGYWISKKLQMIRKNWPKVKLGKTVDEYPLNSSFLNYFYFYRAIRSFVVYYSLKKRLKAQRYSFARCLSSNRRWRREYLGSRAKSRGLIGRRLRDSSQTNFKNELNLNLLDSHNSNQELNNQNVLNKQNVQKEENDKSTLSLTTNQLSNENLINDNNELSNQIEIIPKEKTNQNILEEFAIEIQNNNHSPCQEIESSQFNVVIDSILNKDFQSSYLNDNSNYKSSKKIKKAVTSYLKSNQIIESNFDNGSKKIIDKFFNQDRPPLLNKNQPIQEHIPLQKKLYSNHKQSKTQPQILNKLQSNQVSFKQIAMNRIPSKRLPQGNLNPIQRNRIFNDSNHHQSAHNHSLQQIKKIQSRDKIISKSCEDLIITPQECPINMFEKRDKVYVSLNPLEKVENSLSYELPSLIKKININNNNLFSGSVNNNGNQKILDKKLNASNAFQSKVDTVLYCEYKKVNNHLPKIIDISNFYEPPPSLNQRKIFKLNPIRF